MAGEVCVIRNWTVDTEVVRAVRILQDHVLQILWCYGAAPAVSVAQVEKLFGAEVLKAWQLRLNSIGCYPELVSNIAFTKATIIGYILTLGVDSVELFKISSNGILSNFPS